MLRGMMDGAIPDSQRAAWASYQRMRVRLAARLNRDLARETGLSEADYEILAALAGTPHESVRALALRCGLEWEKSRLSHQLRRMEQRGLVVREKRRDDSRGADVRLTESGRRLAAEARAAYERAIRRHVVDVLSPDQLAALGEVSEALLAPLTEPHEA